MVTLLRIWDQSQRPEGYQVRADYSDGVTPAVYNACFLFTDGEPPQAQLDATIEARRVQIQAQLEADELDANLEEVLG